MAAGPFQRLPLTALEAALVHRVHYIDLSDNRDYLRRVQSRKDAILKAGITVLTNLSTVSGISAILARWGSQQLSGAEMVHIALAPGNQNPRGIGTIASVLSSVGRPIQVWHQGRWSVVRGWTGREQVDHPVAGRQAVQPT